MGRSRDDGLDCVEDVLGFDDKSGFKSVVILVFQI